MNMVVEIINKLKGTNSTKEKQAILDDLDMYYDFYDIEMVKKILILTYDPFKMYGITEKVFAGLGECDKTCETTTMEEVLEFAEELARKNINNRLRKKAVDLISNLETEEEKVIMRDMLCKDLKIGMKAGTINKVFVGLVPEFKLQLAYPLSKAKLKDEENIFITKKLDGIRCICIISEKYESIKLYSRTGKELLGLNELKEWIKSFAIKNGISDNIVLDGELLAVNVDELNSDDLYRKTTSIVNSKEEDKIDVEFHIFDCIMLSEFQRGKSEDLYSNRREHGLDNFTDNSFVKIVELLYVGNDHTVIPNILKYVEDEGGEGLMINIDKPYECKRTKSLLKVKSFSTADVRVMALLEGTGRNKGRLGSIVVWFEHEGKEWTCEVGSGFSDAEREKYWEDKEYLIDTIVEIQYFEVSKNKAGGVSLRFPTWKHERPEKDKISMN